MGAPSNRLLELVNGFKRRGWNVMIVTAMPNYPTGKIFAEYKNKFSEVEEVEKTRVMRYWLYASKSSKKIPRIISMLSFSFTSMFSMNSVKKFKPDFFFVESPPLTLGFSAYMLSRLSGSKMIMNVSDIWPLTAKELGVISDGTAYKKLESLERFLYRNSAVCSGQSEEIVSHLKKNQGNNVYLFRNGVDVKRFWLRKASDVATGPMRIIYAGLIGVAQGILKIVKGINFKELGVEFHIYGEGAEREMLEKFLKDNPDRNVFLHESVSREEIPELLAAFDITIVPLVKNIYGAVPSKIYEAMAAGIPILFSGEGEGAAIIEKYKTGLTSAPGDFENLKKNILELKNSGELRSVFSANCRKTAEEEFDRNKIIDKFCDYLSSISN